MIEKRNFKKSIAIWICLLLVYTLAGLVLRPINNLTLRLAIRCFIALVITGFCFYFMHGSKLYSNELNLRHIKIYNTIFIIIVAIFYLFFRLPIWIELFTTQRSGLINSLLIAVCAGFCEEALFRGMLFNICANYLKKHRYIWLETALVTSILFGLMHSVNLLSSEPLPSVGTQVFYAFASGLMFAYLRLMSNHLWPAILAHAAFDFTIVPKNAVFAINAQGLSLVYIIFGILTDIYLLFIWSFNRLYNETKA